MAWGRFARRRNLLSAAALGAIVLAVGCGGDGTEDDPSAGEEPGMETRVAPPQSGSAWVGRWEGTTSQDLTIAFRVEEAGLFQAISVVEYGVEVEACSWQSTISFADPAPIFDSRFSVKVQTSTGTTDITIDFLSNESSEGSLSFTAASVPDAPACEGEGQATFRATRQP
jgi:hypothetical protein